MSLRVLLADESTTIKKVMQLALQDFAVEVKSVHAGVDVLDVARSYQPDLIFADILLQKKNGYEVCGILKADSELKTIPVVLMWSSFMELDEQQAKNSGAEGRLEKPFDVETLRKVVLELVPKTRSQRLAHFLEFPQKTTTAFRAEEEDRAQGQETVTGAKSLPELEAEEAARESLQVSPQIPVDASRTEPIAMPGSTAIQMPPPAAPTAPPAESWNMDSFEDPEDEAFQPLQLSQFSEDEVQNEAAPEATDTNDDAFSFEIDEPAQAGASDDEAWTHQDLSRFKLDLPPVTIDNADDSLKIDMVENEFAINPPPRPAPTFRPSAPPPQISPQFEEEPEHHTFGDLTNDLHVDRDNQEEIELPEIEGLEHFELTTGTSPDLAPELSIEGTSMQTPPAARAKSPGAPPPQLNAEQLEDIIRAQSRDIIESVVRKIVPDLAAAIIREELERLLEDTAVRDDRKGPRL